MAKSLVLGSMSRAPLFLRLRRLFWPALLALAAGMWLVAGIDAMVRHHSGEQAPYQASAGVAMVLAALVQFWLVQQFLRQRVHFESSVRQRFYASFFIGVVCCYLIGVLLGPDPAVRYIVRAAFGVWYSISLFGSALEPAWWSRLRQTVTLRWVGTSALCLVVFVVISEAMLRTFESVAAPVLTVGDPLAERKLPPGEKWQGRVVNRAGYWDDEFDTPRRVGGYRVAALGRSLTLSGDAEDNCFAQIKARQPGIEIYNLGLRQVAPRDLVVQVRRDVPALRPDLVLVCLAVTDDLTQPPEVVSKYDWRSVRLLRYGARWTQGPWNQLPIHDPHSASEAVPSGSAQYEQSLHAGVRRLAVCRKPLDAKVQDQWREGVAGLEGLIRRCKMNDVPLALVLVPADFQLAPALTETLARRAGWQSHELDIDLPQRRLARFAQQQEVACLDLLPYFRSLNEQAFETGGADLTPRGRQLAAETLGAWLQTRYSPRVAVRP